MQRELDRIEYELVNLRETVEFPPTTPPEAPPPSRVMPPPPVGPDSGAVRAARAFTQEMPALTPAPDPEVGPAEASTEFDEDASNP